MTTVFEYTERSTDYNEKFLRDHDDLPEYFKDYLRGLSSIETNRDDDLEDFLAADTFVPSVGMILSIATSYAAAPTAISWGGIDFQSTSVFDWVATDPTKITCLESGIVDIKLNVYYAASAGGTYRGALIYRNGGSDELAAMTTPPVGGGLDNTRVSASVTKSVTAGDYLLGYENQDSGGGLNITATMSLSYLGRLG